MTVRLQLRYVRYWIADRVTPALIHLIQVLNPSADNKLSRQLHQVADEYDTRPTGEWS